MEKDTGVGSVGRGKEVIVHWNAIVVALLAAVGAWEKYVKAREVAQLRVEDFPLAAQKALNLANPKGQFDFLLEDIMTRADLKEYLKELIIKT